MPRLPHVLFLVLLLSTLSNVYAAENIGTTAENDNHSDRISTAGSVTRGVISTTWETEPLKDSKKHEHSDYLYRAAQVAFVSSIAADLGTTWSLPKNMSEGNPLLGKSKAQQVSASTALALFTLWEAHSLHAQGNKKVAKYLLWIGSIAHAFAGYYNARR